MKLWVGHDSRTHKRTNENTRARADSVNSICSSDILWWGIKSRHLVYLRRNSLDLNVFIHHSILLYYTVKDIFLDIYEAAIPSFFIIFFLLFVKNALKI